MSEKEIQMIKNECLQEIVDSLMENPNYYIGMGYHCEIAEFLESHIILELEQNE